MGVITHANPEPAVRERVPEARLLIAGKGSERLASFKDAPPGVTFTGFVDDLDGPGQASKSASVLLVTIWELGEAGDRHRNRRMEKRVSGNAQLDRRMPEASPWAQLPANVSVKPTKRSPLTAARIDIADARAVGLGFLLCSIVSKRPG